MTTRRPGVCVKRASGDWVWYLRYRYRETGSGNGRYRCVLQRAMPYTPSRHPNHQPPAIRARRPRPITILGHLVVNLVKRGEHIIRKLDLSHRLHALRRRAHGKAHKPLLTQRRIEHALRAKVRGEVHGASEHAAELYVLAEDEHALVGLQGMAQGFVDGGVEVYALCLAFLDRGGEFGVGEGGLGGVV